MVCICIYTYICKHMHTCIYMERYVPRRGSSPRGRCASCGEAARRITHLIRLRVMYMYIYIYTQAYSHMYIYGKICTSSGEYPQRSVRVLWCSSSANNSSNSVACYVYVYIHIYASIYIQVYIWKDMYLVGGVSPEVGAHFVVKQLGE